MGRLHKGLPRNPGFGQFRLDQQCSIKDDGGFGRTAQQQERLRLVVIRSGKIRLQRNGRIEIRDRFLQAGQIVESGPAVIPRFRIRGSNGQRPIEGIQRLQRSLQVLQDSSVVVKNLR